MSPLASGFGLRPPRNDVPVRGSCVLMTLRDGLNPMSAAKLNRLLKGQVIKKVLRAEVEELVIELTDGARLLVRGKGGLDISVT